MITMMMTITMMTMTMTVPKIEPANACLLATINAANTSKNLHIISAHLFYRTVTSWHSIVTLISRVRLSVNIMREFVFLCFQACLSIHAQSLSCHCLLRCMAQVCYTPVTSHCMRSAPVILRVCLPLDQYSQSHGNNLFTNVSQCG